LKGNAGRDTIKNYICDPFRLKVSNYSDVCLAKVECGNAALSTNLLELDYYIYYIYLNR
jgi:hypothetical protein